MTHDPKRNLCRQFLDDLDQKLFGYFMGQFVKEFRGALIANNIADYYRPEGL